MTALWIVLAAALVLWLLSRVRLGILAEGESGAVRVRVRLGPVRWQVYPPRMPEAPKKREKASSGKRREGGRSARRRGKPPKVTAALIRSAMEEVWPPVRRALARFGRGIRLDPLMLAVTLGAAADPVSGAQTYGAAQAAVWTLMPVLERLADVPDPRIHIGVDFSRETTRAEGSVGISVRLGTLLAAALQAGIPAVRWYQKNCEQSPSAARQGRRAA